ncbi:hypothetical protein GCM10020221_04660 [Streptomyces thioluteus]|uniref:Uncharacterized protein n=1 Tax=Streptomyces thioluteus TaxID=66431 RepID=A0ABN3WEV8_STRTU
MSAAARARQFRSSWSYEGDAQRRLCACCRRGAADDGLATALGAAPPSAGAAATPIGAAATAISWGASEAAADGAEAGSSAFARSEPDAEHPVTARDMAVRAGKSTLV